MALFSGLPEAAIRAPNWPALLNRRPASETPFDAAKLLRYTRPRTRSERMISKVSRFRFRPTQLPEAYLGARTGDALEQRNDSISRASGAPDKSQLQEVGSAC